MSISIADLQAKQAALLSKIKNKIEAGNSGNSYEDKRKWEPTFDKETGGSAVIRFLPSPDGADALPYVKVITHFFQGSNGKYYIENSLRTIDGKDPLSELNYRLFQSGIESNQNQARAQKQKPRWTANILVVKDTAMPENNGKVFLYEFGPAVWNLIEEQLFPNVVTDPDKESVNPFNVFNGVNLNLKLVPQKLGKNIVPNYAKTHFDFKTSAISKDEAEIAEIVNRGYSLKEFLAPEKFKSYNELSLKLIEVLGPTTGTGIPTVLNAEKLTTAGGGATASTVDTNASGGGTDDNELAKLKAMVSADAKSTSDVVSNDDDDDDELAKLKAMVSGD